MNRRVAVGTVGVVLLLAVATAFVPVRYRYRDAVDGGGWAFTVRSKPWFMCDRWTWAWSRVDGRIFGDQVTERIHWPILLAEQALIVLLGGGLLTWVVRRERRRRTGACP